MGNKFMTNTQSEDALAKSLQLAVLRSLLFEAEPRDHINDILIALCAAKVNAELVTENTGDMERWRKMLRRAGKVLHILAPHR